MSHWNRVRCASFSGSQSPLSNQHVAVNRYDAIPSLTVTVTVTVTLTLTLTLTLTH
jgi:hypothetical protein